ncbi:hypothetical protein T440DRAFT_472084 [Plenodomus tracheiphilus IPT5]|uniref:Uncharacterized protein n=1 Tax=Plenodomus tracheiphilus IPT5 TaxID=1408161 RepID=A0A6A7AV53_9PLEO|nr:hypothetical protein T440DRAFT_472084 [Plenodomus tracheiphilus IPT5]
MICITVQRTLDRPRSHPAGISCITNKNLTKHHTCGSFVSTSRTTLVCFIGTISALHWAPFDPIGHTLTSLPRFRRAPYPQINEKPRNEAVTASLGIPWTRYNNPNRRLGPRKP